MKALNPNGSFKCAIPMRHIFGIVDHYSKVSYGMRDTLQLIRKDDDDALFRTAGAGACLNSRRLYRLFNQTVYAK